jgi:hypothetical protein
VPKAKVAKEALLKATQGVKIGGTAAVAEKAIDIIDNKALSAAEGAFIGAAAGSALGPLGTAGGALGGGAIGWFLADNNTVFPVDMVCIPAYQAYLIQGQPAFTIYARAGETIVPTGGNVQDVQQVVEPIAATPKKPVKLSKWNRYVKNKKNHIRHKSGPNKGKLNLKAMAKKGGFGRKK